MDKAKLTHLYNKAFRLGANDRFASGLSPSTDLPSCTVPKPPHDCGLGLESRVWAEGYEMGYKVGASDTQLASVEHPGAHGMIRGYDEPFLEMIGFFERWSKEHFNR